MNYLPLHNKVWVIESEKATVTEAGIYLGDARIDENLRSAVVQAVGPDVREVKVGDVVYVMWAKVRVIKQGDVYGGIISEEDILAVLE
jgi:co-chaperonin GroES (HSP10)